MDKALAVFLLFAYFLPGGIAKIRRHHNSDAILLLNLLLGWTVAGWIAALIWAATAVQAKSTVPLVADATAPSPEPQARCPDCRELVRMDARKCKHCGSALTPQGERLTHPRPDDWRG